MWQHQVVIDNQSEITNCKFWLGKILVNDIEFAKISAHQNFVLWVISYIQYERMSNCKYFAENVVLKEVLYLSK